MSRRQRRARALLAYMEGVGTVIGRGEVCQAVGEWSTWAVDSILADATEMDPRLYEDMARLPEVFGTRREMHVYGLLGVTDD